MRILLTNDDGIDAPGLAALRDRLAKFSDVTVVAPDGQRSAASSSITVLKPLLVRRSVRAGMPHYAVSGTPADAVKLAMVELLDAPPDCVVSGMNFGLNTGSNIIYSGTVAGALEGARFGLPAFAVSVESNPETDLTQAARRGVSILRKLLPGMEAGGVCNINLPERRPRGVLVTRQEPVGFEDSFERRQVPRGRTQYRLLRNPSSPVYPPDGRANGRLPTDAWALAAGYASVTPLKRDLTDARKLRAWKKLFPGR